MIKRFYHKLYVKEYHRLAKKRFTNLKFSVILKSMKEFVRKYIQTEKVDEISLYLFTIFNFKSKLPSGLVHESIEKAKDFRVLLWSYSKRGYNKVHLSEYFRILVNNISDSTIPGTEKPCLEHLWESEKSISKNSENYKLVFEQLFERCKETV